MKNHARSGDSTSRARSSAKSPSGVVAFGELLLRLDAVGHDRLVQAGEFRARYTGGEANVAVALAQWGVPAFAVSRVPAHEIGQACVNQLRAHGVNTDGVLRGGPRLGILYVEAGASQRPSKVLYDRERTSFRGIRPGEIDWPALLRGKAWFHFTGTAPALGPNVRRVLGEGLRVAADLGVKVSFDSNFRPTLWSLAAARRVLPELMERVDVFVGSPHDARALFDIDAEPEASAQRMRERFGFSHVAYTLRQSPTASVNRLAGLLCAPDGCHISREYEMQIVDRIGGGDAFTAGILYGLLRGHTPARTVEFASASACLKHTIPGDFNLCTVEEVETLARGGGDGRVRR